MHFPRLRNRRLISRRALAGSSKTGTRSSMDGSRRFSYHPAMFRVFAPAIVIVSLALACAVSALAAEFEVGSVQVINPWTRATPKGAEVAGAYMVIRNKGTEPDRLLGGTSAVASRVEVHKMEMGGGVAQMRPVEGGLEIKPGGSVELKPGSFHLMFIGLKRPLEQGQKMKATLEFQKSGKVDVEFDVAALGASAAPEEHGR
jgi:copper(I)-binding protein